MPGGSSGGALGPHQRLGPYQRYYIRGELNIYISMNVLKSTTQYMLWRTKDVVIQTNLTGHTTYCWLVTIFLIDYS